MPRTRRLNLKADERVVLEIPCSYAPRERALSMVGGRVHVTTERIAFIPNLLASAIGRHSWEHARASLVAARRYGFNLRRVIQDAPSARLEFEDASLPIHRVRLLLMINEDQVSRLLSALK